MTLFKLSMRNLKKSMKDYMVYFATLVLGVMIFYVFNSIDSQKAMFILDNSTMEIVEIMIETLSMVSVFVAGVLGFLIVYASGFLMKRRKGEFAIYMLLGMSKRKIAGILVLETIMIGIISLVVGLFFGVIASQGMSIVIANMFEADLTSFHFVISTQAILKTLLYFVLIYLVVIVFNVFVVGKARLISLLHAGKRNQKNYAKNPVLCAIVFIVAAAILGSAYYNVTGGLSSISSLANLGVEVAKGIVGTILVFWSFSGSLLFWVKKNKRFYYKNLNCFSMREFEDKVNSNVISGSVICIMLFFTICGLSCSQAVREGANRMFLENAQCDMEIRCHQNKDEYGNKKSAIDFAKNCGFDLSIFKEMVECREYIPDEEEASEFHGLSFMTLSDYNALMTLYQNDSIELEDGKYAIICNYVRMKPFYNQGIEDGWKVEIAGKTYESQFSSCVENAIYMSDTASNFGIMVLPDEAIQAYIAGKEEPFYIQFIAGNYRDTSKENIDKIEKYLGSDEYIENVETYMNIQTRSMLRKDTVGYSTLVVFLGLYLGFVFLISAAAILSLKELSGAADNKQKYTILRKLGVDEQMIMRSLFAQSLVFFLLPLLLAVVHSIFGIQTGMFILETFGRTGFKTAILISAGIILAVYGVYFLLTFLCSKSILKDVSYERD